MGCGIPVRYEPHFTILHHHGRRSPEALRALLTGYAFGDGALYAKHLFADRRIARVLRRDVGDAVAGLWHRRPVFPTIRFFHLFRLKALFRGFIFYGLYALRPRDDASVGR